MAQLQLDMKFDTTFSKVFEIPESQPLGIIENESIANQTYSQEQDDTGKCCVCLKLIDGEVMMCPRCSEILCSNCLEMRKDTHCSKCKNYTDKELYIRCRKMEQIIERQKKQKRKKCVLHRMEKVYYCNDCLRVTCPECFRESGSTHFGHRIARLMDEYHMAAQCVREAHSGLQIKLA